MVTRVRVFLRVCANLLRCALWPIWLALRSASRPRGKYVYLKLEKRLTELRGTEPLWRRVRSMRGKPGLGSLEELRQLARQIGRDPAIEGLCISVSSVDSAGNLRAHGSSCAALRNDASGRRVPPEAAVTGSSSSRARGRQDRDDPRGPRSDRLGFASQPLYFKRLLDRIVCRSMCRRPGSTKCGGASAAEIMSDASREQAAGAARPPCKRRWTPRCRSVG